MLNVPCKKAVMFIFLMLSTPMLQQSRVKVKKYANYFLLICFIVRVFEKGALLAQERPSGSSSCRPPHDCKNALMHY